MRFAATMLVSVVLGPPIGGIVFVSAIGLIGVPFFILFSLKFLGASYVIGTVPALVAGLLVAVVQLRRGFVSALVALLIGLSTGTALLLVAALVRGRDPADWFFHVALSLTCVITTFACWAIARALLPPKPGAAT
jgi:hypothetical protein